MIMPKEKRPIQMKFRVSEEEHEIIMKKMDSLGIVNMAAYLRKMAIDGYVLTLDIPELKEMISLLRYLGNNVNQIAKRVNATDRIYESDLNEIRSNQQKLWNAMNQLLLRLGRIE